MTESSPNTIKYSELKQVMGRFFKYTISQYKLFIILGFFGSLIGFIYGKLQPPNYAATSTFIIEDRSGNRGGGLSGLASQFGIDMGNLTGGGGGLFEGDNIFEIMKSRVVVEKVLATKIDEDVPGKGLTLAQYYLQTSGLREKLIKRNIDVDELFKTENLKLQNRSILKDSILNVIYADIMYGNVSVEKQNKKSTIITLSVKSNDQVFTKNFIDKMLKETSNLYIEIKTGNLSRNIEQLQIKVDSLQGILNYSSGVRNYINLTAAYEGASRDKTVASTLYTDVVKNLESMKLSLINQTPVIQILDAPRYPIINQKLKIESYLIIGFLIGMLMSLFYVLYKYTSK